MTGEQLRMGRLSWKLSQETLAKRLGVTRWTIIRWETKEKIPEMARLALLELNDELRDDIADS